jgi:membrane-associated protease RseP (regulator of RpoE activity)
VKDPLEEASADVDRRGASRILIVVVGALVLLAVLRPGARDALAIIAGIVLMVMLHEAGHFIAARRAGMKATEFFLGFGPRLWSFKRGETEFGVKAIPAGGYVRILGMSNMEQPQHVIDQDGYETDEWLHDYSPADEPRTFRRGSYGSRLIVVLAGVTMNLILAFLLFYVVIAGQGRVAEGPSTTISSITPESAAAAAGLRADDEVVAVDGRRIEGWEELKAAIESRGGEATTFTVVRDGLRVQIEATPDTRGGQGFLGVAPTTQFRDVGVFEAVPESFRSIGDITVGTVEGIGRLFSPEGVEEYSRNFGSNAPKAGTPEADARPRSLIGIVDEGSQIIDGNVWALLWLLGGISLVLALFNMIPLLPFDGGHAAVVVYEWIASKVRGREVRVDFRKLMPVTAIVLAVFLTLGLSAMFLDIRQAVGN